MFTTAIAEAHVGIDLEQGLGAALMTILRRLRLDELCNHVSRRVGHFERGEVAHRL
jgi:hypothetical protein